MPQQQKSIVLQFWKLEEWDQDIGRERECPLLSPSLLAFGGNHWLSLTYRYIALISRGCFLCVLCLFSKFPFFIKTPAIDFWSLFPSWEENLQTEQHKYHPTWLLPIISHCKWLHWFSDTNQTHMNLGCMTQFSLGPSQPRISQDWGSRFTKTKNPENLEEQHLWPSTH